ncbi:MAG: glycosyltransferase family 39 protein [Anaerolineae bacterium]
MAILQRVAPRLSSDLKDRLLYLLLLLSAVSLFLSLQLGIVLLPPTLVNVGDESDRAYVSSFHQRERDEWSSFRWTKAHSYVTLADAGHVPVTVTLTLNGWRPEGQAAPEVVLLANGRELGGFAAQPQMSTYQFRYVPPMLSLEKDLVLEIRSDTFSPPSDEAGRTLGVLMDAVQFTPIAGLSVSSHLLLVGLLALVIGMAYLALRSSSLTAWASAASSLAVLAFVCTVIALDPLRTLALALSGLGLSFVCYASTLVIHSTGSSVRRILGVHPWLLPVGAFLAIQAILVVSVDVVEYDEAIFLDVARSVQRTGVPVRSMGTTGIVFFEHTPLYVYFLSLAGELSGERVLVLRLLTAALGLGSVILTFLIGRRVSGPVAGTVGASLLALNPFFATYAFFIRMEVPMVFFLVLATCSLVAPPLRRRIFGFAAAGCSVAIAVLLKEMALAFWAACTVYVFVTQRNWPSRLSATAFVAGPTVIGLSLWTCWGVRLNSEQFQANLARWQGAALGGGVVGARETLSLADWLSVIGGRLIGWAGVLLFAVAVAWYLLRRKREPHLVILLLLYVLVATGASLIIRLKEPRHLIGLIPAAALVSGIAINWSAVCASLRQRHLLLIPAALGAVLLAWDISPLRFPSPAHWTDLEAWWDPPFSYRMFESDRYYGALRDTGRYLRAHSRPDETIAVVHEGTVVGYYADRWYFLLYVMQYDQAKEVLQHSEFLVIDHVVFPHQSEEQIERLLQYVDGNFEVVQVIEDAHRQVPIYRRRGTTPADFTTGASDQRGPLVPKDGWLNHRPLLGFQSVPAG